MCILEKKGYRNMINGDGKLQGINPAQYSASALRPITVLCSVGLATACSAQPFDTSSNVNTVDIHFEGE